MSRLAGVSGEASRELDTRRVRLYSAVVSGSAGALTVRDGGGALVLLLTCLEGDTASWTSGADGATQTGLSIETSGDGVVGVVEYD